MSRIDGGQIQLKIRENGEAAGDAFKELWEHYYPRLAIYISSFKKISPADYDDLISEVLFKVFQNIEKYNEMYAFSTWVYRIAKNYFIGIIRKAKTPERFPWKIWRSKTRRPRIFKKASPTLS